MARSRLVITPMALHHNYDERSSMTPTESDVDVSPTSPSPHRQRALRKVMTLVLKLSIPSTLLLISLLPPTPTTHRRLTVCPSILQSLPYPPPPPRPPLLKYPSYAASFPGSGDKLFTKFLAEAMAGIQVGEAATSPSLRKQEGSSASGGQGHVIAVRTHFPHTSGKLASWDTEIPRAFVILRNPVHAIPSYFNEVYELRNHLPSGSSTAQEYSADSRAAWIKWRDQQFPSQLMLYRRFVSFWMERHMDDDGNRIFFTYEDLVDWNKGPEEAVRLNGFLEEGIRENARRMIKGGLVEGVNFDDGAAIDRFVNNATKRMVGVSDVPCLWREIVYPTNGESRRLQSLDEPYSSSNGGEWDPVERPFDPENLATMSQMLLELMNRWNRHQRVLNIMSKYHREVNKMYQAVVAQEEGREDGTPLKIAPQVGEPPKLFHIIQASHPHSASTVATNWLMGLFEPLDNYYSIMSNWPENPILQGGRETNIETHIVTKTHDMELLHMYKTIRPLFDEVFFVVSYRKSDTSTPVDMEMCEFKNVLCVEYEELKFSTREELESMVASLTSKLRSRFKYFFGSKWLAREDELNSIRRLEDMAKAKIDIVAQPNDVSDLKFGVHGGLRRDGDGISTGDDSHRRLSAPRSGRGCEIREAQPADVDSRKVYAASLPGCGSKISWKLIEALTGLWSGDDKDSNNRGKRIVAVKTHFPHDAGQLVPWDDDIDRAVVIICHPMHAISSFFHHVLLMQHNLPSRQAPLDTWIAWRDRLAASQIIKYAEFIDYWMNRFCTSNSDCIILSYEYLIDDTNGPDEVTRLASFLSNGGVSAMQLDSAPCVWRALFQKMDAFNDATTDLPYSEELLHEMAQVLHDLIQKWGSSNQHVNRILEGYSESLSTVHPNTERKPIAVDSTFNPPSDIIPMHSNRPIPTVYEKSFHIFQASPPHTASTVLNNLLIGLFEPDADYSFMVDSAERPVRQHDRTVPIDTTVVTKTHILDLLNIYEQFRPQFDEVFFVVSIRADEGTTFDLSLCGYSNVLCVGYQELAFSNQQEMENVVALITAKIQSNFEYFFEPNSPLLGKEHQLNAMRRLDEMTNAIAALADRPFTESDLKFGVHGGHRHRDGKEFQGGSKRLFYCGGAPGLNRKSVRYSTFGLFMAQSILPEFEGKVEWKKGQELVNTAIPLTEETLKSATTGDVLIMHSHQFCEVSIELFPGPQIHFNAEYYDIHPNHRNSNHGEYTLDYLPEGDKSIILGPHEDSRRSIRVPYCSMRLWYLHKTRNDSTLSKILNQEQRPTNSGENFLLYINSHYIEYRERAALALSEIGTINTAGKCQGNADARPATSRGGSAHQCVPFDDLKRPPSIQPVGNIFKRDNQGQNSDLFSRYRFALVMENTSVDGYVSEKILDAFLSGSIPVYYGSPWVFQIFNPDAFIFYAIQNPGEALRKIKYLEENPSAYKSMLEQPILANGKETIEKYFSWDNTMGKGKLKSRIRELIGLENQ